MANQNRIDKEYTAAQLTAVDAAIQALETQFEDLLVRTAAEKSHAAKPPDGSGDWTANMLVRANQNLDKMPQSFDAAAIERDIALPGALEPCKLRLQRLVDKLTSAQFDARSDAFTAGLKIRETLQRSGVAGVDDNLNEGMKRYFSRSKAAAPEPAKPATP